MKLFWAILGIGLMLSAPASAQEAANEAQSSAQSNLTVEQRIEALEKELDALKATVNESKEQGQAATSDDDEEKKIDFSGYLQARYELWQDEGLVSSENKDQFQIRRARIKATAAPTSNTQAVIQADLTDSVTTKDAYLSYFLDDGPSVAPTLTFGQFKWPFGTEVVRSSADRETPERAQWSQAFFNGERDKGIKISSRTGKRSLWEAGFFNGFGANRSDPDNHKDFVGRFRYSLLENLDLGASVYTGKQTESVTFIPTGGTATTITNQVTKNRYGIDAQYKLDGLTLMGEYVTGKDWQRADLVLDNGFYLDTATNTVRSAEATGYHLQAVKDIGDADQGVVRYEEFNPKFPAGVVSRTGDINIWHLGWIRFLNDATRFKLFYQINDSEKVDYGNILRAEMLIEF